MDTVSEVKIENLSNWLKSLRLNSGTILHISPHATSPAIAGVEVQDNTEVEKLLLQCSNVEQAITALTPKMESNTDTERGSTLSHSVYQFFNNGGPQDQRLATLLERLIGAAVTRPRVNPKMSDNKFCSLDAHVNNG